MVFGWGGMALGKMERGMSLYGAVRLVLFSFSLSMPVFFFIFTYSFFMFDLRRHISPFFSECMTHSTLHGPVYLCRERGTFMAHADVCGSLIPRGGTRDKHRGQVTSWAGWQVSVNPGIFWHIEDPIFAKC